MLSIQSDTWRIYKYSSSTNRKCLCVALVSQLKHVHVFSRLFLTLLLGFTHRLLSNEFSNYSSSPFIENWEFATFFLSSAFFSLLIYSIVSKSINFRLESYSLYVVLFIIAVKLRSYNNSIQLRLIENVFHVVVKTNSGTRLLLNLCLLYLFFSG